MKGHYYLRRKESPQEWSNITKLSVGSYCNKKYLLTSTAFSSTDQTLFLDQLNCNHSTRAELTNSAKMASNNFFRFLKEAKKVKWNPSLNFHLLTNCIKSWWWYLKGPSFQLISRISLQFSSNQLLRFPTCKPCTCSEYKEQSIFEKVCKIMLLAKFTRYDMQFIKSHRRRAVESLPITSAFLQAAETHTWLESKPTNSSFYHWLQPRSQLAILAVTCAVAWRLHKEAALTLVHRIQERSSRKLRRKLPDTSSETQRKLI